MGPGRHVDGRSDDHLDTVHLDTVHLDAVHLDNMAWYALGGPQSELARWSSDRGAVRYERRVSPLCAVDRLDDAGWASLADLVGPGRAAVVFRADVGAAPAPWTELFREDVTQYVAGDGLLAAVAGRDPLDPVDAVEDIVELAAADGPDMVALTSLTEPGPFDDETHRTGRYFGLRRGGELVAMAGERMRAPGWGEVSAVCVHPSARGEGLGAALTKAAAAAIVARGDRPMLHVRAGNEPAHRLYRTMGFEVRRPITIGAFRLAEGWRPDGPLPTVADDD